ncbi:MAG: zinc ABC transporter substrate-binding protein [Phycisphaerales bacterium]|nr:zinc ABC transporter substrate-binding protein [Phycisphaerales bacterium]
MRLHLLPCLLLAVVAAVTPGCREHTPTSGDQPLTIAVSVLPQAFLVEQVGRVHVRVITLVQPGESPATYQPSDSQVSLVMKAAAYFRIGVPFENGAWFHAIERSRALTIIDTREGIELRTMHADHSHHGSDEHHGHAVGGGADPHIWLSPRLLKIQAGTVARTLAELDPQHADDYAQNLADLERLLDEADQAVRATLEPMRGKAIFVFHPAWGYFTDEYGLRQIAVEIEGKEPTDRELTILQQRAKAEGVKVIFVQAQIPSRMADAIAEAIGGRTDVLDPLALDVPANLKHIAERMAASMD